MPTAYKNFAYLNPIAVIAFASQSFNFLKLPRGYLFGALVVLVVTFGEFIYKG